MAIKIFTFLLLILSVGYYFVPVENIKKDELDKDMPLVIFESSFMYTINEESINRIVYATHAIKYKDRDEMYNADIILKNTDETKDFKSEKLKAKLIIKNGNEYTLIDNVKYTRDDFMKLNTNELFYNDITKIATNTKPFDAVYNKHFLKGDTIYLDVNNDFVKANNTHFEIDVIKKN
ncbi:LPS export ABC transporter periplasmic protein LptC [Arcobacter caeni]|uniref:LPS export ABC transporter periplasmic protein LptC n=1 Tax=Arcobacter caeni TaxID=1912877 RepID=A0A363CX79_9BACT|nr:LPS export ABC transporter periplasmic protein LptC [Arcobacter caeni]PUE63652.1 hypothetical protein B0174_10075 [Arcobacter caeni]